MRFSKAPIGFVLASILGLPLLGGCLYDDDHHHRDYDDHSLRHDYDRDDGHRDSQDWDHDHDHDRYDRR
jgi:hypothetical protein